MTAGIISLPHLRVPSYKHFYSILEMFYETTISLISSLIL